jgi:alanyl-tRNA synthetase
VIERKNSIIVLCVYKSIKNRRHLSLSTTRLYYENAYIKDFTANITKVTPLANDKWAIVLDRTAFYPESGGQPFDNGFLNDLPVTEVQENGEEILHIVGAQPSTNSIQGNINWKRRFDHMQQHSGQHILSGAFYSVLQVNTVSFHLGADSSQIDLDIATLTPENLQAVETAANQIIFSAKGIHTHWPNQNTLHQFPLRKLPAKDFIEIRLVAIDDFDYSACCGTHVANTGEIGLIKIRSWERKNNGIRIDFVCGWRGLTDYQQKHNILQELSGCLSLPITDISQGIEKLHLKAESTTKELAALKQEFYRNLAATLYQQEESFENHKLIVYTLTNAIATEVNTLAKELVSNPHTIALISGVTPERTKVHLVFSASPDIAIDMNQELKNILPIINGKGGGNMQSAQGGGSKIDQLSAALTSAKENIREQL